MKRIPILSLVSAAFVFSFAASLALPSTASAQTVEDLQRQIDAMQAQLDALSKKQEAARVEAETDAEPTPVKAATVAPAEAQQVQIKWGPAPTFTSPDGNFQMKLRGRLLIDAGWVSDDDNESGNISATEFRAARLGIEGKAWKTIGYKFEIDFAGNRVSVTDAYMSWKGGVEIKIGQFRLAPSLEEATSGRFTTFMERASFTDAFGFGRQIGIGISKGGANWNAQAAISRGTIASNGRDEGITLAGRLTYGPRFGDIQVHLGGSARYRNAGDDPSSFRYRQRPHNHLSSRFLDTLAIADSDTYFGLEAAAVSGPLSLQAEYGRLSANMANPALSADPTFAGGYISASWFITGDTRTYKASKGTFDRVKVANPVFAGGKGAWQIAARYDWIDLSDQAVLGGEQGTYILGVNWYLNNHTRLMANYSHSKIDDAMAPGGLNGPDGENSVDAFGLRAQIDW